MTPESSYCIIVEKDYNLQDCLVLWKCNFCWFGVGNLVNTELLLTQHAIHNFKKTRLFVIYNVVSGCLQCVHPGFKFQLDDQRTYITYTSESAIIGYAEYLCNHKRGFMLRRNFFKFYKILFQAKFNKIKKYCKSNFFFSKKLYLKKYAQISIHKVKALVRRLLLNIEAVEAKTA